MNYYSEFDPKAAATLRELIAEGHIAPGYVDERSIEDVRPDELKGFTQVHLFAGFGLWSLAFRWAGISDSDPAWSCSCPCQPFSAAGKGNGFADERHLWPSAFHLIQHAKRPEVPIYGEQVASSRVMPWIDLVWNDLEAAGNTFRPFILASAGFGAPIIRQRTYWVARASEQRYDGRHSRRPCDGGNTSREQSERLRDAGGMERTPSDGRVEWWTESGQRSVARGCESGRLGESHLPGPQGRGEPTERTDQCVVGASGVVGGVGESGRECNEFGGRSEYLGCSSDKKQRKASQRQWFGNASSNPSSYRTRPAGPTNGFWGTPDWLRCRDDKWRPVESGTFPLAHGYPERVGVLRGAGNAISPQVAAAFIRAERGY